MWEVRFVLGMGGDRSIGEANLRKGRQPLQWLAHLAPVRGFAPSMAGGPCRPRSSSKIIAPNRGSWDFLKRTPEAYTNLTCGRFVLCWWIEVGIEALAEPIFVRAQPFNGWRASRSPRTGSCRPCSASKSIASNREAGVWRTNSGSVNEPLMWEVRFLLGMGGDRSIGGANLRKGAPFQWLARLAFALHRFVSPLFRIQKYCVKSGSWGLGNELRKC